MIVLFTVVSFIFRYVDPMSQTFLLGCVFSFFPFFFNHSFWPCCCGFLTFPYQWAISFSTQMILELSGGYGP